MNRNKVFTPDMEYDNSSYTVGGMIPLKVFLGGTIDNGNSDDWQHRLIESFSEDDSERPVIMYNPRRDSWPDGNEKDEISKQIKWELHHLELSNLIVMNILSGSRSPISLMEIGLFARDNKLIVFCPEDFYRFDNVREVCERYGIPLFTTNDTEFIKMKIIEFGKVNENFKRKRLYDYSF